MESNLQVEMSVLHITDYTIELEKFLICLASGDGGIKFKGALRLLLRAMDGNEPEGWLILSKPRS